MIDNWSYNWLLPSFILQNQMQDVLQIEPNLKDSQKHKNSSFSSNLAPSWNQWALPFEIHTPSVKDLGKVFHRENVNFRCNGILSSSIWKSHTLCETFGSSFPEGVWILDALAYWAAVFESHTPSVQHLVVSQRECEFQMQWHTEQLYLKVTHPLCNIFV